MSASYCSRSSALMDEHPTGGTGRRSSGSDASRSRRSAPRPLGRRPAPRLGLGSGLAALADLRGLTDAVAQVVELGPAHIAPRHDLDLGDGRGVQGKRALDADAVAHLADLERLADARPRASDDDTLEHLNPLL